MTVPASSYNSNIPQATDQMSGSQLDLLNNFGALTTWIDQDHVDSASSGPGKHFRVTLPVQSPAPTFSGTDIGFYSFLNSVTSLQEVTLNKLVAGGSQKQIPMTASILSTSATPAPLSDGWTYLPSGLLLMFGYTSGNGLTTVTIPSGATIPVFNNIIFVSVCPASNIMTDPNIAVNFIDVVSPTQFQVFVSTRVLTGAAIGTFAWLAIGY